MHKNKYDIFWLNKVLLSKRVIFGLLICVTLVYLATTPLFTKPLYESEIIVYVPLTILSQQLNQQGVGFANSNEIDFYIQILKSHVLLDSLIKRFSLKNNEGQPNSSNFKKLESRIEIEKTRYNSVSIKVRDGNPDKAAAMSNFIVSMGELVKQQLLFPNRKEALNYAKSLFEQKNVQVSIIENEIDSIERKGIPKTSRLYIRIMNIYNQELQELIIRKNQYERAQKDFNTPLPKIYIVSGAYASNKPAWPHPWILCTIGLFGYLFIIIIIEIIKRDYKQLDT